MWVTIRLMDGSESHQINGISKLTPIIDLREKIADIIEKAPTNRQRLFYRGKQLEDGHTIFDYDCKQGETIQLLIKPEVTAPPSPSTEDKENNNTDGNIPDKMEEFEPGQLPKKDKPTEEVEEETGTESTYLMGDIIDCQDPDSGSWFEARIAKITKNKGVVTEEEDGHDYHMVYVGYEDDKPVLVPLKNIRPRARTIIPINELKVGDEVMVNYSVEEPDQRGWWYDAVVEKITGGRKKKLFCTVSVGRELLKLKGIEILFPTEVFKIEHHGWQQNESYACSPEKRKYKATCDTCQDNLNKKCKDCACNNCGGKEDANKTILCDECDNAYHIYCLKPPLEKVPDEDEWFCPLCKNDTSEVVMAGQKVKESKKKAKMASASSTCTRDWGRGMACAGRSKICTIVPPTHFGPVPGVDVGMCWKFRVSASECGVHRPHVAGISGKGAVGAYSIVLSGGYEDDRDDGDVFTYTGSGGRDLSGNKRTAEQSSDQLLTLVNLALARNCSAKVDSVNGGTAEDWQKGKPVRVIRSYKGRKHSEYAPEEGIRYDGIYKVTKYWRERGKSGFYIWRYELRRDDPIPAPWTKKGKKRIENLGYTMVVPDGYYESLKEKEKAAAEKKGKGKGKRKRSDEDDDDEDAAPLPPPKKVAYEVDEAVMKLIKKDTKNEAKWDDCLKSTSEGWQKYLDKIQEEFSCICCMDLVCPPITTVCSHNICKGCLGRSFSSKVYTCPACRNDLGKDYSMKINSQLFDVLKTIFPSYDTCR